ncbi:hypothetical protein ACFWC9_40670 [Streptomyces goshikiensis]|uniref:hypothetical protein n=1 Tax=Streptomyces goshikiensis TaxID=1942 RepID=UPI0036CDCF3E
MTYLDETESRTVSTLTMSARISESGRITPLPEAVRPVRWTDLWARSGKSLDRLVHLRVKAWVDPLLKAIETEAMPADSAHRWKSQEQWRAATIRETRRKTTDQAHARVTSELRREALAEIEAEGSGFWPVRWEESTKVFLVQGEWTVTVSVSGTDHTAVRSAFASDLPPLIADIVADAQNRIPRAKKTVPVSASTDTPAKVRKAWKRDREKGTAPKAANGAYTPGSWVIWQDPESGRTINGIVTQWTPGWTHDSSKRGVIPSDGSDPVVMQLDSGAHRSKGPWRVSYGDGVTSRVEPGAVQLELTL